METSSFIVYWLLSRLPRPIALFISTLIVVLGLIAGCFIILCALSVSVKYPAPMFGVAVGCFLVWTTIGLYKAMDKEMPRREKKS